MLHICCVAINFQLKQSSLEGDSWRLRKKTTHKAQEGPRTFQTHKASSFPEFTLVGNTTGEEGTHCTERPRTEPRASHTLDKHSAPELHSQPPFYFLNLKQGLTKLASQSSNSPASCSNLLCYRDDGPVSLDRLRVAMFSHPVFKIKMCWFFISCVWAFSLHVCLCTTCMSGVHRYQKKMSDPLELELWMVVSFQVLGIQLWSDGEAVLTTELSLQPHVFTSLAILSDFLTGGTELVWVLSDCTFDLQFPGEPLCFVSFLRGYWPFVHLL